MKFKEEHAMEITIVFVIVCIASMGIGGSIMINDVESFKKELLGMNATIVEGIEINNTKTMISVNKTEFVRIMVETGTFRVYFRYWNFYIQDRWNASQMYMVEFDPRLW
jgi:hypothetical protein